MKCTVCKKEFLNEVFDYDLYLHFITEHKKEVIKIGEDIVKKQKILNNEGKKK